MYIVQIDCIKQYKYKNDVTGRQHMALFIFNLNNKVTKIKKVRAFHRYANRKENYFSYKTVSCVLYVD